MNSLFRLKEFSLDERQSNFLDAVRGGAALMVLYAHCVQIWINPYWYPHKSLDSGIHWLLYSHLGSFGVMAFFVLSGFLIFLSVNNNILSNEQKKFDLGKYTLSRLTRLYPPLVFCLFVCCLLYYILNLLNLNEASQFSTGIEVYLARSELKLNFTDMFGSLFYLNTIVDGIRTPSINGPLWSLAHEFWFYVVFALIILSLYHQKFLLLLFGVTLFIFQNNNSVWFYGFLVWLAGGYAAWAVCHWNKISVRRFNYLAVMLLVVIWSISLFFSMEILYVNNRQKFLFGMLLASILPVCLSCRKFLLAIDGNIFFGSMRKTAPFAYTLYLLHCPILLASFALFNRSFSGRLSYIVPFLVLLLAGIIWTSKMIGKKAEDQRLFIDVYNRFRGKA